MGTGAPTPFIWTPSCWPCNGRRRPLPDVGPPRRRVCDHLSTKSGKASVHAQPGLEPFLPTKMQGPGSVPHGLNP